MNSDISRIPIQSLSAVVSLTDILPDLPLPVPLQTNFATNSLLCDPLSPSSNTVDPTGSVEQQDTLLFALEHASTDNM